MLKRFYDITITITKRVCYKRKQTRLKVCISRLLANGNITVAKVFSFHFQCFIFLYDVHFFIIIKYKLLNVQFKSTHLNINVASGSIESFHITCINGL